MKCLDILIPHYNDFSGLKKSIKSVEMQSWEGTLRVVVADDGSPIEVFDRVEKLLSAAPFSTKLLRNTMNRGRPHTRNRLLDEIQAPFVAWLDAGDLWLPDKLSIQFEHLDRLRNQGESVDDCWITCNYDWRWEQGRTRNCSQNVDQDQVKALLMGDNLRGYLWTILASASTFIKVGGFDENLPRLQDLDYFLRFAKGGGRLVKPPTEDSLCIYEKSDIGRDSREIRRCNARIFAKHADSYYSYGPHFLRVRLYKAELLSARFAKNNGDILALSWFLLRAFMTRPFAAIRGIIKSSFNP
jgi:glycosyltransferase involved in cell wall biosynthesis